MGWSRALDTDSIGMSHYLAICSTKSRFVEGAGTGRLTWVLSDSRNFDVLDDLSILKCRQSNGSHCMPLKPCQLLSAFLDREIASIVGIFWIFSRFAHQALHRFHHAPAARLLRGHTLADEV